MINTFFKNRYVHGEFILVDYFEKILRILGEILKLGIVYFFKEKPSFHKTNVGTDDLPDFAVQAGNPCPYLSLERSFDAKHPSDRSYILFACTKGVPLEPSAAKQSDCVKSRFVMLNLFQHLRICSKFVMLDSETSSE